MTTIEELLFTQGFGTRRVCAGLVQQGRVAIGGATREQAVLCTDTHTQVQTEGLVFWVHMGRLGPAEDEAKNPQNLPNLQNPQDWQRWDYHALAYVAMNKPAGYECSQKPGLHPSVYTLLPGPLRQRGGAVKGGAQAGVQAVGRLDVDTTGLLILSDDGKFIHRLSSPRHHVPKVYEVKTRHPVTQAQIDALLAGVVLHDEPGETVAAAACTQSADCQLQLTLTQGKYHQVKRMLAAVGNRVDALHRSSIGGLHLDPAQLLPGAWRWLTRAEVDGLLRRE